MRSSERTHEFLVLLKPTQRTLYCGPSTLWSRCCMIRSISACSSSSRCNDSGSSASASGLSPPTSCSMRACREQNTPTTPVPSPKPSASVWRLTSSAPSEHAHNAAPRGYCLPSASRLACTALRTLRHPASCSHKNCLNSQAGVVFASAPRPEVLARVCGRLCACLVSPAIVQGF